MSKPAAAERFHAMCRTVPLGLGERYLALRGEQPRVSASDALPLPETQTPLSPRRRGSLPRDTDRPSPRLDGPFGALFRTKPPKPPKPSKPTKPAPKRLVLKGQCSRFPRIAAFSSIYGFRQIAFLRQRSGFWRAIIHGFRRFRRFRKFRKF